MTLNTISVLLVIGVLSLLLVLATGVRRKRAKNRDVPMFLLDSECAYPPDSAERESREEKPARRKAA